MKTTTYTTFNLLGYFLIAISITLLYMALMHIAQTQLASIGWHGLFASVSWNG